jgi:triosephosphate isomerase
MKNLFILGNWKSNKTTAEAVLWQQSFVKNVPPILDNVTIILCPAYHHVSLFAHKSNTYATGVQNISPFDMGAYTGEVAASMVKDDVTHAMIGHSERRKHFGETDEIVAEKVKRVIEVGIKPVVCVSNTEQIKQLNMLAPEFAKSGLLLYEPLFAIGSGTSDSPENANAAAMEIQQIFPTVPILYGGSVTHENVKGFTDQPYLSGVGVGGASLDPDKFVSLIRAVLS